MEQHQQWFLGQGMGGIQIRRDHYAILREKGDGFSDLPRRFREKGKPGTNRNDQCNQAE